MDEPPPQRRRSRRWRYGQQFPGESPGLALERAVEEFETYVARVLTDFDRPVEIRATIEVAELPLRADPGAASDADDSTDSSDRGRNSETLPDGR